MPVQLASHSTEPQQVGQHTDILQDLPQSSREKAGRLLRHLQRSPGFKWDSNSRLILDGNVIEGSNIIDLIYDAVRQGESKHGPGPRGGSDFYRFLQGTNVPSTLLNKPGRQQLDDSPKLASNFTTKKEELLSPSSSKKTPRRKSARTKSSWEGYH